MLQGAHPPKNGLSLDADFAWGSPHCLTREGEKGIIKKGRIPKNGYKRARKGGDKVETDKQNGTGTTEVSMHGAMDALEVSDAELLDVAARVLARWQVAFAELAK